MKYKFTHPLAITMWDFSWLERRWTGAGFEDWNLALDELTERGYDAVRIDAYPHLLSAGPDRVWTLKPQWNQQVWGAPALTRVDHVKDNLLAFIALCKKRNIMVGLSTWFREDLDDTRLRITTPDDLAQIWIASLDSIAAAGLLDAILYVDFCNEYPLDIWAPFLKNDHSYSGQSEISRTSELSTRWMRQSIEKVRAHYPQMDYTFSQTSENDTLDHQDISALDFLEPHLWMANYSEFYQQVGYSYERFDSKGYDNMALYAEGLYHSKEDYWNQKLCEGIEMLADWSRKTGYPLITTECWSVVDYKDWPLLDWGWIRDLCEIGVKKASSTGRWAAIGTSNFCAPQFVGMWRDVAWHRALTGIIKSGRLPE